MRKIAIGVVMIMALGTASASMAQTAADAAKFTQDCSAGNATSCADLGVSYDKGLGVPQDTTRAAALYDQACTAKEKDGCFYLGMKYHRGDGVPVDLTRAKRSYELACHYGSARGCYWNGIMWGRGEGGGQRYDMAIYMFKKALAIDPDHAESKDAIARLEKLQGDD